MIFCDWQLFWHRHYERPPLVRSVVWGKGYTEYLADDGRVRRHHYDTIKIANDVMAPVLKEIREYRSLLLASFKK